jgi:hypothetical protein
LAKAVLDRLGGRVELSSELGRGSIATVVLPGVRGARSPGHG